MLNESARILAQHYQALRADPDSARRMGWSDRRFHLLSFELLTCIADLRARTVLDVGCGVGDLYAYLRASNAPLQYTGLDLVDDSVAEARARFPEARWLCGDFLSATLEPHDYVLLSGLFDVAVPDSPARMRAMLARAFALCTRGVAWNMFTVAPDTAPERQHLEPLADLLDACAALTPTYTLRHDYAPAHFTVYLYKRAHFVTPALERVIGRAYLDADFRARCAREPLEVARECGISLQELDVLEGVLDTIK